MKRILLKEAAQWYAEFCSDDICRNDLEAWQQWVSQSEEHAWAWRQVEQLQGRLQGMPGRVSVAVWQQSESERILQRRRFLKGAGVLAISGGALTAAGYSALTTPAYQHTTRTGERRSLTLEDGSNLVLNTASAIDTVFSATERLIVLGEGEILITTAPDPAHVHRPLSVMTAHGKVRALGTRFMVRVGNKETQVTVLEHDVEITPGSGGQRQLLTAGETASFSNTKCLPAQSLQPGADAWCNGMLIVHNWPLSQVLDELSRYSVQRLRADSGIRQLRLSGAFPLDNIAMALQAIATSVPVDIEYRWQLLGPLAETRLVVRKA